LDQADSDFQRFDQSGEIQAFFASIHSLQAAQSTLMQATFTRLSQLSTIVLLLSSTTPQAAIITNGDFSSAGSATVYTNTTVGMPAGWAFALNGAGLNFHQSGSNTQWNNCTTGTITGNYQWVHAKNSNDPLQFSEIYQSITISEAGTLALTWSDAGRDVANGNATYTIRLDEMVMGTFSTVSKQAWGSHTLDLGTVAAGTYKLAFRNITTTSNTAGTSGTADSLFGIDNVAATLTPVPEPTTLGLLGLGGLAMACGRRSRRK
jgi:hypothetical protein